MSRVELTRSQREFIYARTEYINHRRLSEWTQAESPQYEIHHWRPVGWQVEMHGETEVEYNSPHRLILLTKEEHHRVHPDIVGAIANYWKDKQSFSKVFTKRRRLMEQGRKYWVTTWDGDFQRIARENTLRFMRAGNSWPERCRWV